MAHDVVSLRKTIGILSGCVPGPMTQMYIPRHHRCNWASTGHELNCYMLIVEQVPHFRPQVHVHVYVPSTLQRQSHWIAKSEYKCKLNDISLRCHVM
jgi:hypothetical protein